MKQKTKMFILPSDPPNIFDPYKVKKMANLFSAIDDSQRQLLINKLSNGAKGTNDLGYKNKAEYMTLLRNLNILYVVGIVEKTTAPVRYSLNKETVDKVLDILF